VNLKWKLIMIKDSKIEEFLDNLAGKSSTPGGGSAAAVIGAIGAALVSMVANFTVGKKGYESVNDEMASILARSEKYRMQFLEMIQADVDVFNKVMSAYGMSKSSDQEQESRSVAIQDALKKATDVPLQCAVLCLDVIELSKQVADKGNTNVISDAGVAVLAAEAALGSAALNVYINISNIKDKEFADDRRNRLEAILNASAAITEEVYSLVKTKVAS
jgi:formiminotetrahydrofolate cyclodeaminase